MGHGKQYVHGYETTLKMHMGMIIFVALHYVKWITTHWVRRSRPGYALRTSKERDESSDDS